MADNDRFEEWSRRVEAFIEDRYRIPIVVRDIPDPLTGDLDGQEIHIDYALLAEERLFLLAHLFGHTVQWNVSPFAREIGKPLAVPVPEDLLPAIAEYEREAGCYGLALFHQVGATHLDQWLSDYTACDMAFLMHYYRTGEKKPFRSFWVKDAPLLRPVPIPEFRPQQWVSRLEGIVL